MVRTAALESSVVSDLPIENLPFADPSFFELPAQGCTTLGRFQCRHTATRRRAKQVIAPAKVIKVGASPALRPATMTAAPASAATA
jgi:hypothetical protein